MRALVGVVVVASGAALVPVVLAPPTPAVADVEHGQGFAGVVDGYRSWFGSYRLGGLGEVWCVDHGIAAPDEALAYEPTALEDHAPETRRAIAWAVGRHGTGVDRVGAAALMLVLHDFMGARYPTGPLSVDTLTPDGLRGFGGEEDEVLERARAIKADAVTRSRAGAPSLTVEVDEAVAGAQGRLRARVVGADGEGIVGVVLHPTVRGAELEGDVDRVTGDDGAVVWSFTAGAGRNAFVLEADVPGAELVALRPTRGAAQRVARPASAAVRAETSYEPKVPRQLTIHKHGHAGLPVAGATFQVSGVDGELVVGEDGRTPPVSLLPGTYEVIEIEPPPGYDLSGPWTVVVNDADVVLDVEDPPRPGWLDLRKVDARTGERLDGAVFDVTRASDREALLDWSSPLLPGRYEIRERVAPPHHRRADEPVIAEVRAGERTEVLVPNDGLATVAFRKHPALAGATFSVSAKTGEVLGRCTTGDAGTCALAEDSVDAGAEVCWTEVEAPPGWAKADGGCVEVGEAGTTTTIDVIETELAPEASPDGAPTSSAPAPAPPAEATPEPSSPPAPVAAGDAHVLASPPAPREAAELPRTGAGATRSFAGLALVLLGVGLALVLASRSRNGSGQAPSEGSQLVG